jgi:hypothetical protein
LSGGRAPEQRRGEVQNNRNRYDREPARFLVIHISNLWELLIGAECDLEFVSLAECESGPIEIGKDG